MSVFCAALATGGLLAEGCSSNSPSTVAPAKDSGPGSDTGGGGGQDANTQDTGVTGTLTAKATLTPQNNSGTTGTATFSEVNGVTTLTASVQGATAGTHGLHVHAGTSCDAPGPHYGPDGGPYHGEWKVVVGDGGATTGTLTVPTTDVTVSGGPWTVVGHAIVFHSLPLPDAGPDAGPPPRAACGVIQ